MSQALKSSCHFPLFRPAAQKHEEADYDLEFDLPIDFDDALVSEHVTLGGRFVVALPRNHLNPWDAGVPNHEQTPEALVAAQAVAGRAEFSKSKRLVLILGTAKSIDFVSLLHGELNLWRHVACDSQEALGPPIFLPKVVVEIGDRSMPLRDGAFFPVADAHRQFLCRPPA